MLKTTSLFAAFAAGISLSVTASAQAGDPVWTNLGELRTPPTGQHVLTGKAAAIHQLEGLRADLKAFAFQEPVHYSPSPGLESTNTGELKPLVHSGHVLTGAVAEGATTILYAPSESDDPAYRAAISAAAGGATVDYFDARVATPSVATLSQYDAVHTWANFAYADNVTFGNNLAAYNDAGGTVVLGVFCTYTSGNFLSGQIMTSQYNPVVSPAGNNHFSSAGYAGDGSTCIYTGVTSLVSTFRDFLVTQGTGVVDGTYTDAEICHAYRGTSALGQGEVVYSNGSGALALGGTGQWGAAVGNSATCSLGAGAAPRILYAPSEADDAGYRAAIAAAAGGATVDYFDASFSTPRLILLQDYDAVHTFTNFAYHNSDGFGDRLAKFADAGRDVILGAFCTYTSGNFLSGDIMTPGYNPVVSPLGNNHFSTDTDTGPFSTCLGGGVTSVSGLYRDFLTTQGNGVVDSTYDGDGEICLAYRPNSGAGEGNVVYANGSGGAPIFVGGDWGQVVANATTCTPASLTMPVCAPRAGVLGLNPTGCDCVNLPKVGEVLSLQVEAAPSIGTSTMATFAAVGLGGATSGISAFGHELLILPPFIVSTGLGSHNLPIPDMAGIVGTTFAVQGGRVEAGPSAIVLTNGVDLHIGM